MSARRLAQASSVTAAMVVLLAGCGDDPDVSPFCDRGPVAAGDSVTGVFDGSLCIETVGSDTTWSESWTLAGSANTAYVVRLYRLPAMGNGLTWEGGLTAYTRGANGAAQLATIPWGTFGAAHDQPELVFTTDAARTMTLQVSVDSRSAMGPYALRVEGCPVRPLVAPDTLDGIDLAAGCTLHAFRTEDDTVYRVGFVSLQSPLDTSQMVQMFARRTAGNALIYGAVGGPGTDLACAADPCHRATYPGGTVIGSGTRFPIAGRYTYLFAIPAGQTGTVSVEMYLPVFPPTP